jgi:hypothetical protein
MSRITNARKKPHSPELRPIAGGRVGVFWFFKGRLVPVSVNVGKGASGAVAIDSPFDHILEWPHLQKQFPALAALGYEEVPRGRVLFLKRKNQFVVYLDKVLTATKVKRTILKEFQLPTRSTVFETDSHYTTDPAELDRLFGQD